MKISFSQEAIAPYRAGIREWAGLVILTLPCLVVSMDLTVLNLALPHLSADLQPTSAELLWIVDIYGFLVAGSLITMGTIGDRVGRRRLLLIGAAAFGLASILGAYSTTPMMLITVRALLGLAGATLMPSTLSLITNMFVEPAQRTLAIGLWTTSFSVGGVIGPIVGGLLLEHFWWGSVLLVGVPVMGLLVLLGPVLLPEYRASVASRYDFTSAAMSIVAILAVIYGIKRMAEHGIDPAAIVTLAGGVAIGFAFVRRQLRLPDPHIDVRLFRLPRFRTALSLNTLGFFVMYGVLLLVAQYLQSVVGLTPLLAGLWLIPFAAGNAIGAVLTPFLVRFIKPALLMASGLVVTAAGCCLLAGAAVDSGFASVIAGTVLVSVGPAPVYVLAVDMIVGSAPAERSGAASAISETSNELGGALGIALIGAVSTFLYRRFLESGAMGDLPSQFVEQAKATLGGAMAVAEQMPDAGGVMLTTLAQSAFVHSMAVTAYIAAGLLLMGAVAAVSLARRTAIAS